MRGKTLVVAVCCAFMVMAFCTASYAASGKVGYINLQRLVNESKMGKAAKKDIDKMRKNKETNVAKKLDDLKNLRNFINKNSEKLPVIERRDKIAQLKNLYKEYQRLVADSKDDITREDRELVSIILEKANDVLKKIAKKRKFTIILKDPNAIGYLDPAVDITDAVLKELNK